jgi:tetratricopeptide (TPR) repeat protein
MRRLVYSIIVLSFLCFLSSCQKSACELEPQIVYTVPASLLEQQESPFPAFTTSERRQEWARELFIAKSFAKELDFYRAITSFKRALFLLPRAHVERQMEIEFGIIKSYYLGLKHQDAVETFEKGKISEVTPDFPAFRDLIIILYESYSQLGDLEKACRMLSILETFEPETANKLELSHAVEEANLGEIVVKGEEAGIDVTPLMSAYCSLAKSPQKAQLYNALLPGAGYLYVGQRSAAVTSFVINALFIAAAYHFFSHKNYAAGLITTSLETGWYFGGINGAGIAAREYNERLYECHAKDFLVQQGLFPVLMLNYSF